MNVSYGYDSAGRLNYTLGGGVARVLTYDGTDLVAEHDPYGVVQRRYVHGPGDDDPLVWYEGPGTADRRWLHADERGSITAISNSANSVVAINAYDEYGIPASTNQGRFQYTGQTWLPEVGLYYYKARVYSPTLGRFLQTDPTGYDDGINWYDYVSGDPVNAVDPDGRYGRGSGFSDGEWKNFDKDQQSAAKDMERTAEKLDKKASKLDGKGKAGKSASARQRASHLRSGARDLKGTTKIANQLTGQQYRDIGGTDGGAARARIGGNTIWISKDHSSWSGGPTQRKWNLGHESLHTGAGLSDKVPTLGGSLAYKNGSSAHQSNFKTIKGTSAADQNPDHLMDEVY